MFLFCVRVVVVGALCVDVFVEWVNLMLDVHR